MSATAAPGLNSKPESEYLLFKNGFQRFITPFSLR